MWKIIENWNLSFLWKNNRKKVIVQKKGEMQLYQEKGVTNIYNIQNITIPDIKELAGSLSAPVDSKNLLETAGRRFLIEQNIKQKNLKAAVDEAELDKIIAPHEPEKDWFLKWMDAAQGISKENLQKILGKILSNEIRRPESFSIRTLEIVKNLSKNELELFQKFCDISYSIPEVAEFSCVLCNPFGNPGSNALKDFGLSYGSLTLLQDAGLIQNDFNSYRELPQMFVIVPFKIGSQEFHLKRVEAMAETDTKRLKCINFTRAGLEIKKVMKLSFNKEYNDKLIKWICDEFKLSYT